MRDLLDDLDRWAADGRRSVLARVAEVGGSGPRLPGAAMAVDENGEIAGTVTGGCVESAVVTEALDLLDRGGVRVRTFGFGDDDAFSVGLTCGGTVRLLLQPLPLPGGVQPALAEALRAGRPAVLATRLPAFDDGNGAEPAQAGDAEAGAGACLLLVLGEAPADAATSPANGSAAAARSAGASASSGAEAGAAPDRGDDAGEAPGVAVRGSLGDPALDRIVARDALAALDAGSTVVRRYGPEGMPGEEAVAALLDVFAGAPRLIVFGAVDVGAALARAAALVGFHVTVADPRAAFATPRRFPSADVVTVGWPDRVLADLAVPLGPRDAVCVLTHDRRVDVPAIVAALGTEVGYLGAMGSRRTQEDRVARLRAEGVDDHALARVHGPIGLDIGARTPAETAVSILAEVIAARTGRSATSLRDTTGPIHG